MRFRGMIQSTWRSVVAALRGSGLAAVTMAILLAGCSKHPQDRYDWAMDLAKTYSVGQASKEQLEPLGPPVAQGGYIFSDLAYNPSFVGKFHAAAEKLGNQEYVQNDNRDSLLGSVDVSAQASCEYGPAGRLLNAFCRDGMLKFQVSPLRRLHTDLGDFLFASAAMDNDHDPEMAVNASQLVIVVDPSDGGLGLILEDHVATIGGRADVLATALTLVSSIVRLEIQDPGRSQVQAAGIRYDLEAARAHTLFRNPLGQSQAEAETAPAQDTPAANSQATPPHLTKQEFQRLVVGKSMTEIRKAFGRPSNTNEDADGVTWYYWSNDLQVEDPDSGTIVTTSAITFDPATKTAVGVHF